MKHPVESALFLQPPFPRLRAAASYQREATQSYTCTHIKKNNKKKKKKTKTAAWSQKRSIEQQRCP